MLIIVVSAVAVPCVDPAAEYVATELRINPVFAVMLAAVTVPDTPREVSVPTDVIFAWLFAVTLTAVVAEVAVVALPALVA